MVYSGYSNNRLLSPFFINNFILKLGGVESTFQNFEKLIKHKNIIVYFPEGVKGSSKAFYKKYQIQKYSTSFIRIGIKHQAIVVPVSVVNGEVMNPLTFSFRFLNNISNNFGFGYIPFGLFTFFSIFPSLFFTCFPTKLTYVFHDPIELSKYKHITKNTEIINLTEKFKKNHQHLLNNSVKKYKQSYNLIEFIKIFIKNKKKKLLIPFYWHEFFLKATKENDLPIVFFKVPLLGWLFLFISILWNSSLRQYILKYKRKS